MWGRGAAWPSASSEFSWTRSSGFTVRNLPTTLSIGLRLLRPGIGDSRSREAFLNPFLIPTEGVCLQAQEKGGEPREVRLPITWDSLFLIMLQ